MFFDVFIRSKATNDSLLTTQDAARRLGFSPRTLEEWRSTGRYRLPFLRIGRSVRYSAQALDRWLAAIRPRVAV